MDSSEILSAYQSPAKKQRYEGAPQPVSPLEETEDPRSKIEFYTYDEDVEDDSDGMHEITQKELDEYLRQINESDGFNVMHFPRSYACGQLCPILDMERDGQDLKSFSQLALQQYNDKEKKNLEFVKVVKANWEGVAGIKYYITFDVKDPDAVDGRTMEFQASVWDGISKTTINFCRPKPNRDFTGFLRVVRNLFPNLYLVLSFYLLEIGLYSIDLGFRVMTSYQTIGCHRFFSAESLKILPANIQNLK